MSFLSFFKKTGILAFCIAGTVRTIAQQYQFRLLPLKDVAVAQQSFVGKLGERFFLYNLENPQSLELYIYDMSSQTGRTKVYPFPRQKMTALVNDSSLLFVSTAMRDEIPSAYFLELDKQGELLQQKEIPLSLYKQPVRLLPTEDKKHILFYQLSRKGPDSLLISGTICSAGAEIKKQLYYHFRYNPELDMEPVVFLDNHANTHVLVTDKYSNYRLSADLTINTIPFEEEQILSETFSFNQVKLKNIRVFQNREYQCLQAEGMYVNGLDKNNKGFYSIALPEGRKNELAPRFIPFQTAMIRNFREGFSATDEMIQKNIELQDILYSDDGSYMIARLNVGTPQKTGSPMVANNAFLRSTAQMEAIARATNATSANAANNNNSNQQQQRVANQQGQQGLRRNNMDYSTETAAPMPTSYSNYTQSMLSSRANGRNAPKFICIKLDKTQGVSWYTTRTLDIFNIPVYNKPLLAGPDAAGLTLVVYQPDAKEEPNAAFIGIRNGKQLLEKFPQKKMVFSPLTAYANNQFCALYMNADTLEGGILLVNNKSL